jgi:hypothetical protein
LEIRALEECDREGYLRQPQAHEEVLVWEVEAAWPGRFRSRSAKSAPLSLLTRLRLRVHVNDRVRRVELHSCSDAA